MRSSSSLMRERPQMLNKNKNLNLFKKLLVNIQVLDPNRLFLIGN